MRTLRSRLLGLSAVLLMLASVASTQPTARNDAHVFHGRVAQVDSQTGKLTIQGEEVKGWMGAMTMSYTVDSPAVAKSIKPGDRITAVVYDRDFGTLYSVHVSTPSLKPAGTPQTRRPMLSRQANSLGPERNKITEDVDDEVAYACPMHSDFTAEQTGKCPRCGMTLVATHPYDTRDYTLDFRTSPAIPKAGEDLKLFLRVAHPQTGQIVKKFEAVHEKQYHLFVIGQDMNFFEHIHPLQSDDGTWTAGVKLPKPGAYQVLSDFVPSGGAAQFLARPLITAGFRGSILGQAAKLVPDPNSIQTVEDLTATVGYDPKPSLAGQYCHLAFHLTNAKTRQPITDLQTYLGAFGHMLIMSEDMVDYVHSHPIEPLPPDANLETIRGGPDVTFEGLMPKPGMYRAWTQFRYHDKVLTFVNTFRVYDITERAPK